MCAHTCTDTNTHTHPTITTTAMIDNIEAELASCNIDYNHTVTKLDKFMLQSFTQSFADPVPEYLWSCPYTFHFFPQIIAGPRDNPIPPAMVASWKG